MLTVASNTEQFLEYLSKWEGGLQALRLEKVIEDAGGPDQVAIIGVDLLKGFTTMGPLSGPRVAAIVPTVRNLLQNAVALGVTRFVFVNDSHPTDSPEFEAWPAHCVEGSEEAKMADEIAALPFAHLFSVFPKTSLDSSLGTALPRWLEEHPVRRVIVVGDCTDLCVFHLAMYLRMRANVERVDQQVLVAADCVQTYDLPVVEAQEMGAMPHDGDLMQRVFLYQMALNGIRVYESIG